MKKEKTPEIVNAPLNKRMFAYLIDWYFGWIFTILPIAYYWNIKTGDLNINTDLSKFSGNDVYIAGLLGLLFAAIYFFLIPLCTKGQTMGKKLFRISIRDEQGQPLKWYKLALRQIVFVMILESSFMISGNLLAQLIGLSIDPIIGQLLTYCMMIVFLISLFTTIKYGKALHDYIVSSKVIELNKEA